MKRKINVSEEEKIRRTCRIISRIIEATAVIGIAAIAIGGYLLYVFKYGVP